MADTKGDCHLAVTDIRDAVETAVTALENAGALCEIQQEGIRAAATEAELAERAKPTTYVDRVKRTIPAAHAAVVAKAELQKRKIRLTKAAVLEGEGMGDLSEKQWVEKAVLYPAPHIPRGSMWNGRNPGRLHMEPIKKSG